jgi:prepilin-type N-terminal cleavage/methylation domain-containing protein
MKTQSQSAFTLIEMLVVISIIAVLAAFAVPALTSALTKGQMTGTLNNGRQLYLAGQQMALDGSANSDPNLAWPGDYTGPTVTTLSAYASKLVQNDYLKTGDLQKLLSAPGATCTATGGTTDSSGVFTAVTLAGTPALKVYEVKDAYSANTIFTVTNNYVYNNALTGAGVPFADKGFIVQRKGGDASIYRKNSATAATATGGDGAKFQGLVGKLVGDPDGGPLGTEAAAMYLAFP